AHEREEALTATNRELEQRITEMSESTLTNDLTDQIAKLSEELQVSQTQLGESQEKEAKLEEQVANLRQSLGLAQRAAAELKSSSEETEQRLDAKLVALQAE